MKLSDEILVRILNCLSSIPWKFLDFLYVIIHPEKFLRKLYFLIRFKSQFKISRQINHFYLKKERYNLKTFAYGPYKILDYLTRL